MVDAIISIPAWGLADCWEDAKDPWHYEPLVAEIGSVALSRAWQTNGLASIPLQFGQLRVAINSTQVIVT
eukprot:3659583-Amphidinium_carterae.1